MKRALSKLLTAKKEMTSLKFQRCLPLYIKLAIIWHFLLLLLSEGKCSFLLREPPPDLIRDKWVSTILEARDEQKEHLEKRFSPNV